MREGPLSNGAPFGWVLVDRQGLRHVRHPEIFALGDVCDAPTSKPSAAIRRQAPVVAENVQFLLAGKEVAAQRDGGAPCSITTACGRLLLAEFAYSLRPHPTFPVIDTTRERADLWWLKRSLLAWLLLPRDAARLELRAPRPWCWAEPAGQLGSWPRPEAPPRVPGAPLRYRRSCA